MKIRVKISLCLIIVLSISLSGNIIRDWKFESNEMIEEYENDSDYLQKSISVESDDKGEFNRRAAWLDEKWSKKDNLSYLKMLFQICFYSTALDKDGYSRPDLMVKYFKKAEVIINTLSFLPIEIEFCYIYYRRSTSIFDEYLNHYEKESWEDYRLTECSEYLEFYSKLQAAYDPSVEEPDYRLKNIPILGNDPHPYHLLRWGGGI